MLEINLRNKVAIVTGISSGIGIGIVKMLAKAGANVAGCSRKQNDSKEVKDFIALVESEGQKAYYSPCDISKDEDIARFVKEVAEHFSEIDILISNAGANVFKGAEKCSLDDWQYNLDLNLKSHWNISRECKPFLEKSTSGVIQIMTSNHAYATIPGCFPYNVTKTALTGLVRSMAIEWGPKIRVLGLAPGFIETPGAKSWFESFPDPKLERQKTIDRHPAGKLGSVEEIGAYCAFLASEYCGFATGNTLLIDGGRSALMQDD